MSEQYGPQSPTPYAVYNRDMSSWKTLQPLLELANLPEQSVIWPKRGMTRRGVAYALPMQERLTGVSGASSLLPTPRCGQGIYNDLRPWATDTSRLEDAVAVNLIGPSTSPISDRGRQPSAGKRQRPLNRVTAKGDNDLALSLWSS